MGLQDPRPFNFVDLKVKDNKTLQIDSRTILLGAIFLLLLIISAFSFVYFLYTWARRRRGSSSHLAASESTPGPPPPLPGLDKATIGCLPTLSYGSGVMGTCRAGECSICLGAFQEGEKVKALPLCNHWFHSECVDKWLQTRSSCPLCRASVIPVDSVAQSELACCV